MIFAMPIPDLVATTYEHLDILDEECSAFVDYANFKRYKVMATELRLLLTGSSGQVGLILQVLPNVPLHPLLCPLRSDLGSANLVQVHATIRGRNGGPRIGMNAAIGGSLVLLPSPEHYIATDLFNPSGTPLPLPLWLEQPFLMSGFTIRQFIKLVGNKDALAHVDLNDCTLRRFKKLGGLHALLIAEMGRTSGNQIARQLAQIYPRHYA
jgi:hypothetical protein